MKFPRARRVCRPLPALLLALAACAIRSTPPGRPDPPSAASIPELLLGEPVERELAAGEKHVYRLDVPPGSYLRIVAEPRAMDVALTLLGPDGSALAATDGPGGSKRRELLSVMVDMGGSHRVVVERRDEAGTRRYSVELQELRKAVRNDVLRVEAERLFATAFHLHSLGTAEARKQAMAMFEESFSLWQEVGDRRGEVECLNHLGLSLYSQGQVKEAVARYEQALAAAQAAGYRVGEGEALNNLGLAYSRLAEAQKTVDYYERALAIWRDIGNTREAGRTLHNLGVFFNERGEPGRALASLEEALSLRQAAGDLAGEANTLNTLGALHLWTLGEARIALDYLYRALPLSRAAGSLSTEAYVTSALAAAHQTRGEIQQALGLYGEAVSRWERLGDPTTLGNVREALAGLYAEVGELEHAAGEYRKLLDLYQAAGNPDYEARVLTSLGLIEFRSGDASAALARYERALAISRATGNRRIEAVSLQRSGMAHLALGNSARALETLQECLDLTRALGNRADEANTLLNLGIASRSAGKTPAAVRYLEQALDLARRAERAGLQASILFEWAELDRQADRLEEARPRLEEAIGIIESGREQVASRDLRATYFAARREYYHAYIDLLMRLEGRRPGEGFARSAFEVSERARARSLLELLAEGRVDVRQGIAPALREREKQLAAQISATQGRLGDLLSKGGAGNEEQVARFRGELDSALHELRELESEIRLKHPRYAQVRYPPTATAPQIQASLGPDVALLEYALGPTASYLFVITDEQFEAHRLPPAPEINQEVERLRKALVSPERRLFGRYLLSAHRLYELLVAPAAGILKDRSRLVVVADDALHLLPFEALIATVPSQPGGAATLPFLLRTHTVSYVPSASVLLNLRSHGEEDARPQPGAAKSLIAFANPLLDQAVKLPTAGGGGDLPDLPESRREVEGIAQLFESRDVSLFLGLEATEDQVKREGVLASARRVHFATHAFLSDLRPELSGLVLARSASSGEDGLLQVYEIFNLQLDSELVVLSACDSALGKAVAGEGLVGLVRAFLYAGTPRLVVSLWSVRDASTADLMIEFYRRLRQDADRAEALRAAKLRALSREERAHPYYWAPYVLLGEA